MNESSGRRIEDVHDLPVRYRVGRRNGHTIYLGGSTPDDGDVWVGCARTRGMAHTLVELANVGLLEMNRGLSLENRDALNSLRELRGAFERAPAPDVPVEETVADLIVEDGVRMEWSSGDIPVEDGGRVNGYAPVPEPDHSSDPAPSYDPTPGYDPTPSTPSYSTGAEPSSSPSSVSYSDSSSSSSSVGGND